MVTYFIPWCSVEVKSESPPFRLVFEATQCTKVGCSINSMNKLFEILIRWTVYKHAFHTDIAKICPSGRKVIKTLIYGVQSSSNLAEYGLGKQQKFAETSFREHKTSTYVIHLQTTCCWVPQALKKHYYR